MVYPLYYKYSQGNIPDNIQKCEDISRRSGLDCVFRIVEHTNYHLSSILTDNGYVLKECGVVGEWNITEDAGNLYALRRTQDNLFLKNRAEGKMQSMLWQMQTRLSALNGKNFYSCQTEICQMQV